MKLTDQPADQYIEEILGQTREVLLVKAKEYARNGDRMHNFNTGSELTGKIRERIMQDFRLKHEISRLDLLTDIERCKLPSKEYAMEKYGDIINYNILELISVLQRIDKEKDPMNEKLPLKKR